MRILLRLRLAAIFSLAAIACGHGAQAQPQPQPQSGTTRVHNIAADEIDWNYVPGGGDKMQGSMRGGYAKDYTERGPHSIGTVYRKAVYREYTDATFAHLKPRPAQEAYLGLVGPVIHAEVGDTIEVVFRNHGTHSYSVHPHGVFYDKASEGANYGDGMPGAKKGGASVAPGATFTYVWKVPERAGPGPADPSSIVWLYHSHVEERRDVNSGLVGAIVVTRKGQARPDGTPADGDREVVSFFVTFDENWSWFLNDNIRRFVKDTKKLNKLQVIGADPQTGGADVLGRGFAPANVRWTVNGYQFAAGPMPRMKTGDHVRWYVVSLGEGLNFHTPHWHGNTVLVNGQRTDVLSLAPAQMLTADMVADDPGTWLFHCHVSEHMEGGMAALYQVIP